MLLEIACTVLLAYAVLTLFAYAVVLVRSYYDMDETTTTTTKQMRECNVGVLIAHPDDEAMFFGPTIRMLGAPERRNRVHVLCMTTGNYYGVGERRRAELTLSCAKLLGSSGGGGGGRRGTVEVVDDEAQLADDPLREWNMRTCCAHVERFARAHYIDALITFDAHGVSGHANHIALYRAVQTLGREKRLPRDTHLFCLTSVNRVRKYMFVWDLLLTLLSVSHYCSSGRRRRRLLAVNSIGDYVACVRAMMCHRSQLVWFRWLYITASRYMIINDLHQLIYNDSDKHT